MGVGSILMTLLFMLFGVALSIDSDSMDSIDGYCYDLWIHSDKEMTECLQITSLLDCHNTPGCKWTSPSMTVDEQQEILNDDVSFEENEENERHFSKKALGHYSTVFIVINVLAGIFIILLIILTFYCYFKAFTNVANNTGASSHLISDSTPLLA